LQGIGTAGAVSVASGAAIAPGNSIGTITVGSIAFAPGSIYEVEANNAGQADRINVTGAAAIGGGTVQVLAQNGTYGLSTQYTILSAAGGISGAGFSNVTSSLAFLTPSLQQSANAIVLTLKRNTIDFDAVGGTFNQRSAGHAVQSLGAGAVYNAVLGLDIPGARTAFDAVSGEIHASLQTTLIEDSRYPREAVLRRLEYATGDGFAAWAESFGSWGANDADGNAARLTQDSRGFVTGIDTSVGVNWRAGLAGGYSLHTLDLPARSSTGSVGQTYGLAYVGGEYGPVRISFGAGYSHLAARTDRSAVFPGFTDRLRAAYGGSIIQGFGELGYRIGLSGGAFEPFARVAVVRVATDGFAEAGGAAALRGGGTSWTRTTTTLGLHFATPVAGTLSVDARVGWRHALGGATPVSTLQFVSGGSAFAVAGVPSSREAGVAEGGVTWQANPGLAVWTRYSGVIGDEGQDNSVRGGISLTF
ncbi:MAG: outer rane autotransporter barrel domain protein, partial [Novosphingobium sp.]|nr:outer rane autotransporter barrel domain protein [Novosphingobium sp.]